MTIDVSQIINALVESQLIADRQKGRYYPRGNVVTVAYELGSGGRIIARKLAERLGVEYYDQKVLDAIVVALPEDKAILERLDRHVSSTWDEVMHEIVTGRSALDEYRRHLFHVILAIGRKSGVIIGRGAHLILERHKVFRVYVVGSLDVCAARLVKRESMGLDQPLSREEARQRVLHAHEDHVAFIKQFFNRDLTAPGAFDLVLNTDHIPVEVAPDVILYAMERAGFDVSEAHTHRGGKAVGY